MAGRKTKNGGGNTGSGTATLRNDTRVTQRPPQENARLGAGPDRSRLAETKSAPRHDEIARAAYLRWLREGGDAATNWLAAEAELKGRASLKL